MSTGWFRTGLALIVVGGLAVGALVVASVGPTTTAAAVVAPVEVAVVGDFGSDSTAAAEVASMVAGWDPALVLTTGDNYYPPSTATGTARYDRAVGRHYCGFLRGAAGGAGCPSGGTASTNRFLAATGNHDVLDGDLANYLAYFDLPGAGNTTESPTGSERYYDVRRGPLHVFVLDSQGALTSAGDLAAQRTWLQSALAASTAPWQVVVLHHPPHSSGAHGSTVALRWPYAAWGADLVLSGHDHTYERVDADGIPYVVDGLGGAPRYSFTAVPVAGSVVRYNADWGALRLRVDDTSLVGEFVTVGGSIVDRFVRSASSTTTVRLQDGVDGYTGTRDTSLVQATPTVPAGSAPTLLVDGDDPPGSGQDLTMLLRFDTGTIPAGATVVAAGVVLDVVNASTQSYGVFPMLRAWDEAAATWTQAAPGVPWGSAGAAGATDRGTAVGTLAAPVVGPTTLILDAAGVALVQGWVHGTVDNVGLVVAGSAPTDGIDVASRESAVVASRPALVVTYTLSPPPPPPPPPTTAPTTPPLPPTTAPPSPTLPGIFGKSAPGNGSTRRPVATTLQWRSATGAASYEVCVDADRNAVCNSGWVSVGTATSRSVTLARGKTWSWQVRARNVAGVRTADGGAWWRFATER